MNLTPFYEKDGITYESKVSQSNTCRLLANGGHGMLTMYCEIQKLRDIWIEQFAKEMPAGLCKQSWFSRMPDESLADACAMMTFIKEKYPKQAKRLFCGTDDFKDFATAWAVCQFDMYQDILEDNGDAKYQRLLNLFKRKGL